MLLSTISDFKDILAATLHLSRDALHVHIGLGIFLVCAALLRGEHRFRLAFILLLGLCLFNEVVDFSMAVRDGGPPHWLGSAKDILNTMFWPGVWLVARRTIQRLLRLGEEPDALDRRDGLQDLAR